MHQQVNGKVTFGLLHIEQGGIRDMRIIPPVQPDQQLNSVLALGTLACLSLIFTQSLSAKLYELI